MVTDAKVLSRVVSSATSRKGRYMEIQERRPANAHSDCGGRVGRVPDDVSGKTQTISSVLSVQKKAMEGLVRDLIENVKKIRRTAKESGITLDPNLFLIEDSPSPEPSVARLCRKGRSGQLFSLVNKADIAGEEEVPGLVNVSMEKKEDIKPYDRRKAQKKNVKKTERDKLKRQLLPKQWTGGIPRKYERLMARGQRGVLREKYFFESRDQ